jgi:uncharacterized repeat protein (TIGR01451 family)
MPTQNTDSRVIAVSNANVVDQQRSRRIVGISLGATLVTIFVLFAAMALAPTDASANTCTLTSTAPITLWGDATKWSGCGGNYPGQAGGDTAIVTLGGGYTLKVDAFNNPVILQISGSASSIPIQVASGGTLTLETSSTATSNNTFTVNSGGTMGTNTGANIAGFQGNVTVNGGNFNSAGTIAFTAGSFTFAGGTLTGGGSISANNGSFTGATSTMSINATTFNDVGSLGYSGSTNVLTLGGGANINVSSGSFFNLQNDLGINGTTSESINILSGGTLSKTSGSTFNIIAVSVNNNGTIATTSAPSGGSVGLSGPGTHTGSFQTGSTSNFIAFGANNSFNSGTTFSGGSAIEFKGGTQTFNAPVTAGSGIKWIGGTIAGSGPLSIPNFSGIVFDGSLSQMILTGFIQSSAAMSYAPTANLLTIDNGGVLEATTPGSLAIAGDYDILSSPVGSGTLKISGTANVTKTGGASGSTIYAFIDSPGSTLANSATGPLNIAGGGASTGSISVPGAANIINFTAGTFDHGGVFSGSGTINVGGGTLNVNTATTFNGSPKLAISSGTLGGSGAVTLTGTATWSGGTITGSNPFTIISPGALTLTGANGAMSLDGIALTNSTGNVTYISATNNLTLKNAASIATGGTFTVQSAGTIDTDGSATVITNSGTFTKTTSAGIFNLKPTFNHSSGNVSIATGVLDVQGAGTSSAGFSLAVNTEVWFRTPSLSTYTWTSGTSFAASGKVTVEGPGTVATTTPITFSSGTGLEVTGGTFNNSAAFTVTSPGTFKWKGGTLSGAGHFIVSSGTTTDATTVTSSRILSAKIFDNSGTFNLNPTSIAFDNASTFNNFATATFDIKGDGFITTNNPGATNFFNTGTVQKSVGSSGFRFDMIYSQTGGTTDSQVAGGTIIFNGGGALSNGIFKSSNSTANIDFFAGNFNLNGGTLNSTGPGPIRITGGTVQVNTPMSTTNFAQNAGTLLGTSDLTVPNGGKYQWNGGTMNSSGQLVIALGGILDIAGGSPTPLVLSSQTINNSGTITYHPLAGGQVNQLTLQGTGSIINQSGALINVTDNSSFLQTGGATTIVNSGNFLTSGSSSVASTITNNPTGLIKPSGGMLSLLAGTSNGSLDAVSPGAINFGSGATFTITGGTWGGSGGGFWVTGGTVTVNAAFAVSSLALNSGQINGTATLTLNGSNAWGGGTMAGSGTTSNSSGATLTMSNNLNSFLDARTFTNNGTVAYQNGGSNLHLQNGAVFNNANLFDIQGDVGIACNCAVPPLFNNTGTLRKLAGTGNAVIDVPLNNNGVVNAGLGNLKFFGAGAHNGSFTVASGSAISFDANHSLNAPSSLTGVGAIDFSAGTSTINSGTITLGTFSVDNASVTLNAPVTARTLTVHNAAFINGPGSITLNSTGSPFSFWTGGTIGGSGTLTLGSTSNLIINGLTAAMTLDTRSLVNNGSVTYTSTTNGLTLANGAVITNASGAILSLNADAAIGVSGINNVISNAALMQRNFGATLGISPAVLNTGSINAYSGVLAFNGGLTQTIGSTNLLGGSISSPSTIALSGGTLTGNGTVSAAVNNTNGIVAPGNPSTAGTLTITGAYAQGVNAGMALKIGGTSNYDIVDATASGVTLGGTLTVSLFNAFTPSSGNTFDVLKFSTRSGDFTTYNLPTFGGGGSLQNAYVAGTPNVLRLSAVVTSSDLQITQVAPSSVVHGQSATWTLTITNGPTPVTNVSVTDTFANASFVSATSVGACTPSGSTVTCAIGSLAANQSVNVSLTLNASSLVTIANGASVTATEFDPNTANNNTGNANTTVLPAADLSITNTASGNPVNAGSPLSFALIVSNGGPDATSGTITVSNTVPSGVTGATGSGPGWTCGAQSGSVVTCTSTTSISASSSAPPLTISMTAPASGPAVDSASVSASTADPNAGNNSASQTVTITPKADLSITKNTSSAGIAGQSMVYTVVVTNNGPSSAAAVSVADTTPAGLTFVSNSGGCTSAYPCALGTLTNGQSVTITSTYSIAPSAAGSVITNTATVSSTTADPSAGNNTAVNTTSITGSADVTITKSGPGSSTPGSTLTYTITVTNNGPSDAASVTVTDATPANTTFVSNSGACTSAFPCALGTMTPGQTKTITSDFTVSPSFTGTTIANSANVSSTTADPAPGNNTATATTAFGGNADLAITKSGPASANSGSSVAYTLTITNNGPSAAVNVLVSDPTTSGLSFTSANGACPGGFPCFVGSLGSGQSVTTVANYTVTATSGFVTNTAFVSGSTTDTNSTNDDASVTTQVIASPCGQQPPTLTAPANGATVGSPVTFSWTAVSGATSYKVFASIGGASTQEIGSTSSTSLTVVVASGAVTWSVQAIGVPNCGQLNSANGTFNVCSLDAPVVAVVGTNTSGQTYTVQWTTLPGIINYELQEAATAAFDNVASFTVAGNSKTFTKTANTPTAFFYRVRAIGGCSQNGGPFSASERVVIVPIPPINTQDNSATVDINNKKVVIQNVFIPGQGPAIPYFATTDEPWLTVSPASGILPPAGITLQVSADPADLPNGTFTATIIVTFGSSGKLGALDTKPAVSVPVSISVVTPVSPATLSTPPANALIIPSVGHLDGINSQWRSDVRITNTAPQKINYLLRFTPAGGDNTQIKQTQISIAANDTTALDDIVKNWYGVGALGDAANGVLEVRPLNTNGKGAPNAEDVNVSLVTVASSRTFNQSAGGTLGQYIPAIPFANFVGKVSGDARAGILSMQQISQSAAYRTNLGIVEASGKAASVLVSVFDAAGKNLLNLPIDLKAGEQQQLNSFLATKNITLTDGRIEVKVTGGDGKVIAYASVVDNKTTDPLLVTGVPLAQTPARTYVLPGVADLSNGLANWRTDLRVFNSGTDPQYVTMTLYPQTGSASSEPLSRSVSVNPGEVTIFDNVLASRFGVTNIGGALHVDTLSDANLVVTGRTYNQVEGGGTYGQFIGAVTPADAVGKGGRTLNVLQVEDSTRYRTNLGIAEVNGKPATVEVSVILPDAKVVPKLQIPLAANEYRQFRVLQQLGVGTAYNARITIKVIDGEGKIAAYGSVIDMQTQDPTYVPAQ